MLLLDQRHEYRGYHHDGAVCRVRIFAATDASSGLPTVVVTQVPENDNTSVTNMVEYLAAEVLSRYLTQQDGLNPPFHYVEHYPDDCSHPDVYHTRGRHMERYSEERFSLLHFGHCNPEFAWCFGARRLKFGKPEWEPFTVEELTALIGEAWVPEFIADYPQRSRV